MNITGRRIRELRKAKGLTQDAFAAKCQLIELELTRSTLAKIESNCRQVTDIELLKLSKVLNVNVAEFFEGLDSESEKDNK